MPTSIEQPIAVPERPILLHPAEGFSPTVHEPNAAATGEPVSLRDGTRSSLLGFFDAFLQEQNIKWILAVGMAILFGSSAMLVAADWVSFPPLGKFATLLGYTAAIFLAGEWSYHALGLRRTGAFLKVLTVLLIPVSFLALRWLPAAGAPAGGSPGVFDTAVWLLAGGVGLAFSIVASRRIFRHALRGEQPTFLIAYLTLAVAGALPADWALPWPLFHTIALWAVLTAGTVKVSRHVFWLLEERRWPRICGFAPVALLGAQFVTLFMLQAAPRLATDWLGLACALAAVPVLLTGDAVLRVFEQRTGGLVRPLPLSVLLPVAVGLMLSAAGLWLAGTGWPQPYALVPTAALAALVLGVAAARLRSAVLVWLMLATALVAYRFCPLYFQELAQALVETSARAVKETRLPLAFYGLTCLPFIAGVMAIGRVIERRSGHARDVFVTPLRQFAVVLSILLLVVAFTHAKAILPVAAAMSVVFAVQARMFGGGWLLSRRLGTPARPSDATDTPVQPFSVTGRSARLTENSNLGDPLLWLSAVSFVAAGFGFTPFAELVLGWPLPPGSVFTCVGAAAALLTWPGTAIGHSIERSVARQALRSDFAAATDARSITGVAADGGTPFRLVSLATALLLAPAWLAWTWTAAVGLPWPSALLIAGLLLVHALWRPAIGRGEAALVFTTAAGLLLAHLAGATFLTLISAATVAGLGLWTAAIGLRRVPQHRLARAFAAPARLVSIALLSGLTVYHIAALALVSLGAPAAVGWFYGLLVSVWCFDAARRMAQPAFGWLGCAAVLAVVSSGLAETFGVAAVATWYAATFALVAVLGQVIAYALNRRVALRALDLECGDTSPLSFSGRVDRGNDTLEEHDVARKGKRRHVAALHRPASSLAAISGPLAGASLGLLFLIAFGSLAYLGGELRLAGAISAVGLLLAARFSGSAVLKDFGIASGNWQILAAVVAWAVSGGTNVFALSTAQLLLAAVPLGAAAAVSGLFTSRAATRPGDPAGDVRTGHRILLQLATVWSLGLLLTAGARPFAGWEVLSLVVTFAALAGDQLRGACADRSPGRVWMAEGIATAGVIYLSVLGVIALSHSTTMFVLLGVALALSAAAALAARGTATRVLERPFQQTATYLPLATVAAGIARHLTHADPEWLGLNSLALLLSAGFYFWLGLERRRKRYIVTAACVLNVALAMLWQDLAWSDPQFYMVPLGVTLLGLVELLKTEIPRELRNPLRYAGALVVLVSPTFHIVDGSWAHILTLMLGSVAITLAGIGLRIRVLAYLGTGFLAADLVAMVVRGSVDHPNLLWIAGLGVGAAVIALAAFCENHRETLLSRLRVLTARLETWE